ncbi:MAG: hypothetical protein ACKOTF_02125, partial [Opitutaceae bacterium]
MKSICCRAGVSLLQVSFRLGIPVRMPAGGFRFIAPLLLAVYCGGVFAQTSITWVGSSGNFSDAANWSPSSSPNSLTTVVFSSVTGGQVLVSAAGSIQGIQFSPSAGSYFFSGSSFLSVGLGGIASSSSSAQQIAAPVSFLSGVTP